MKKSIFRRACAAALALTVLAGGAAVAIPQSDVITGIEVCAASADKYVEADFRKVISYKDPLRLIGYKYVIINTPKILLSGEDALAVNDEIHADAVKAVSDWEAALADKSVASIKNIDYEAFLNGNILSVVLFETSVTERTFYYVYNFDVTTGKRLNNSDIKAVAGISDEQVRLSLIHAIDKEYDKTETKPASFPQTRDMSISDSSLDQALLFFGSSGKLSACVTVYAPVTEIPYEITAELDTQPALSLNYSTLTLGKGESFQLTSNLFVQWRTSAPKILTVDSTGKVTAKGEGVAWATARTANGAEKSCKITVKAAPESVELSKGVLTIGVGEKYSVSSTVNAGSASTMRQYRTSNSSVVKMTKTSWTGEFVGVKPGVAYVTVRTFNGKEKACKVTVKAAPSKVTISKSSMSMTVGDTASLSASVSSDAGCALRTFRTSDPSVIKMTKTNWTGDFKAMKPGVAWVTVRTYNGKESSCRITVTEKFDPNKYAGNLKNDHGSMTITRLSDNTYQINTSLLYYNGNKISATKYITPLKEDHITYTTADSWNNTYRITLRFSGKNVLFSQSIVKKNTSSPFVAPNESSLVFSK